MDNLNIKLPVTINGVVITPQILETLEEYHKDNNQEINKLKNEAADIVNDLIITKDSFLKEAKGTYLVALEETNIVSRIMQLRWEISRFELSIDDELVN